MNWISTKSVISIFVFQILPQRHVIGQNFEFQGSKI